MQKKKYSYQDMCKCGTVTFFNNVKVPHFQWITQLIYTPCSFPQLGSTEVCFCGMLFLYPDTMVAPLRDLCRVPVLLLGRMHLSFIKGGGTVRAVIVYGSSTYATQLCPWPIRTKAGLSTAAKPAAAGGILPIRDSLKHQCALELMHFSTYVMWSTSCSLLIDSCGDSLKPLESQNVFSAVLLGAFQFLSSINIPIPPHPLADTHTNLCT